MPRRLFFPNMNRPKKAAKRFSSSLKVTLAASQRAIAVACGYRDWHEMEGGHAAAPPSVLDQNLAEDSFRSRMVQLCLGLSREVGIADGDIQAVLPTIRLTGDRPFALRDHHRIRTMCWRAGPLPWQGEGEPGSTFFVTVDGGEPPYRAYRRAMEGGGVFYFSDQSPRGLCADFEAVSPPDPEPDFIPLRLWLPYGRWGLKDGSEVLYSRDYKPLWKIHPNGSVERMQPSEWIHDIAHSSYFFKDIGRGFYWHDGPVVKAAKERLKHHGISSLPRLVDVLPLVVTNSKLEVDAATQILDQGEGRCVA